VGELALAALLVLAPVRFPNSGSPAAQPAFLRGLTALHNFDYDAARAAFREAEAADPSFALAYWGEAMAANQSLWLDQDLEAAREALQRLGPTPEARAARAPTPREKEYLGAVEALFGSGDRAARDLAYAQAMGRLAARFPDDLEAQAFHALALMATAARSPALFREGGDDDAHAHALAGSAVQGRVAAILTRVLAAAPDHPGALHYLIHDYDDPAHARLALPAARAYAKVAARSSHALHMPAHIFLQLGMWEEAAASDEASFAASDERVRREGLPLAMRDHHSLSWLLYESLQLGRLKKAREALDLMAPAVEATGAPRLKALRSDMRARFVVETGSFAELANAGRFDTTSELFAIGMSAARQGDPARAEMARVELARRAGGGSGSGSGPVAGRALDVAVMEREMAALAAMSRGQGAEAAARMEEAVALEGQLPPPLGLPRPLKPASELQGEMLLALGRAREAEAAFDRALARAPNRSLALLGRARAAAAAGDRESARAFYRRLLANWRTADPGLPGLEEARKY